MAAVPRSDALVRRSDGPAGIDLDAIPGEGGLRLALSAAVFGRSGCSDPVSPHEDSLVLGLGWHLFRLAATLPSVGRFRPRAVVLTLFVALGSVSSSRLGWQLAPPVEDFGRERSSDPHSPHEARPLSPIGWHLFPVPETKDAYAGL